MSKKDTEKEITKKVVDKAKEQKPFYKRWYFIVAAILFVAMMIFNYNYTLVLVHGESMKPNYSEGNLLFADKQFDYINRFDVVVINASDVDNILIKRVIGLPGETVEYKNNQLFINGEFVEDIYSTGWTENFSFTLSEDCYFCMGDNREHSYDSRKYGEFERREIFAKVRGRRYVKLNKNPMF